MFVCACVRVYVCMYLCICVFVYLCVCACVCMVQKKGTGVYGGGWNKASKEKLGRD